MLIKRLKPGRPKRALYSRAFRVTLYPTDGDLLPFFQQLDDLPTEQRNTALLAAIRGGAAAGQRAMEHPAENRAIGGALEALLGDL